MKSWQKDWTEQHWNSMSCLRSSKERRLRSFTTDWTDGLDKWQMISLQLCYIFLSFFWLLHNSLLGLAWSGLVWPAALTTICHLQTTNQPITVIGSWWFWNYWSSENFIDKACLQSVYYLVLSFNFENSREHLNLHDCYSGVIYGGNSGRIPLFWGR